jgi:hypothetical protein
MQWNFFYSSPTWKVDVKNQHLTQHLSHNKSRCLTNIPTSFGARRRHLKGAPPQLLTFQHAKWFGTTIRQCAAEKQSSFTTVKRRDLVYERWCIMCWFIEGKISMSKMHGMYNVKIRSCVLQSLHSYCYWIKQ